jgi:hypothetical protein
MTELPVRFTTGSSPPLVHEHLHFAREHGALHDLVHRPVAVDQLGVAVGRVGLQLALHELVEFVQHLRTEERGDEGILAPLGEVDLVARDDRAEGLHVGAAGIAHDARRLGVERRAGGLLVARLELVQQRIRGHLLALGLARVDGGLEVADHAGAFGHEHADFLCSLAGRFLRHLRRSERGHHDGSGRGDSNESMVIH